MTSALKTNEDPVTERKKLYITERQIPALFEVKISPRMYRQVVHDFLGIDRWIDE